jgi:cell division protein FtsW (lipid II flippase)
MKAFVRENGLFFVVLLVLVGAFLMFRTKGTKFASLDEFDTVIASGQPVIVEFYGNT